MTTFVGGDGGVVVENAWTPKEEERLMWPNRACINRKTIANLMFRVGRLYYIAVLCQDRRQLVRIGVGQDSR